MAGRRRGPVCGDLRPPQGRENPGRWLALGTPVRYEWWHPFGTWVRVPDSSSPAPAARSARCARPEGGSMPAPDEQRRDPPPRSWTQAAAALDGLGVARPRRAGRRRPHRRGAARCRSCAARFDVAEARVLARWDTLGRVAPVGRQDRGGVAGVEAADPDRRGAPAAAPRPGDARPAADRGGVGGRRDRPVPRHHDAGRAHRAHREGVRARPRDPARVGPVGRVRRLQGALRPLGAARRPRRRRAGRRRRPRRPRGPPVAVLRRHVVREDDPRPDLR